MVRAKWSVALATAGVLGIPSSACLAKAPVPRIAVDPTPLRLVEERASSVISDGERFVVISSWSSTNRSADVYDTFTGRRTSLPAGCARAGIADQTTVVTSGRALIFCAAESTYRVLDLATGASVADLPTEVEAGGMRFSDPRYGVLGRRWIQASVDCPDLVGCAAVYYDYRTGQTRLSTYPDGPEFRSRNVFYDLDAPDLPLQRVCRPTIQYDEYTRHYQPPYYVDRSSGLRRCGDGALVQRFARIGSVRADLTPNALAWGTTAPDGSAGRPSPYVNVYQLRRRRLLRWRLPPLNGRRAFGTAVVTHCELFALTSRTFDDRGGDTNSFRVHRARLPAPRDPRCGR